MHRRIALKPTKSLLMAAFFLTGAAVFARPAGPTPFDVLTADFEGEEKALVWTATVRDTVEPALGTYQVTKAYGGHVLQKPPLDRDEQELYRAELTLPDGKRGTVILRKQALPAVEARVDAPLRIRFKFQLEVGLRLHIQREQILILKEDARGVPDDRALLDSLDGDSRRIAVALAGNDATELESSRLVQMALWLLTSERPLGPSVKKLQLRKCRATIDDQTVELPVGRNTLGGIVLRLPAREGSRVLLRPDLHIREFTAYSNTVVIKQRPLPSYGFVKLTQQGGPIRAFARSVEPPGTFEIGPLESVRTRRLELLAAFPLEPPGENPRLRVDLLFRSGRPVEPFLDKGTMPPPPSVPRNLTQKTLIPFLLKMVDQAINPDSGSIEGVGYRHLVDLYAIAFTSIQENTDLLGIVEQALLKDIARRSWTHPKRALSGGTGWTAEDAEITLAYPALAPALARKVREEAEPRRWIAVGKDRAARKEPDRESAEPHALAIAALSRSADHEDIVRAQLKLLAEHKQKRRLDQWDIDELTQSGQPLKLAVLNLKKADLLAAAQSLLREIRAEALRRFTDRAAKQSLADRIQLAHLVSPIWRPHVGTPPRLLVDSMDIDPSGPAVGPKGTALEEVSLRFQAALMREVHELRPRKIPNDEKARRVDALAERWFAYLQKSQGRLPDDVRRKLEDQHRQARSSVAEE